jgi:hypothetical protein
VELWIFRRLEIFTVSDFDRTGTGGFVFSNVSALAGTLIFYVELLK